MGISYSYKFIRMHPYGSESSFKSVWPKCGGEGMRGRRFKEFLFC